MVSGIPAHQTHKHRSDIPCPSFGKSGFLGNSQIPDAVIIFIIFPILAHTVFWSNPENSHPDPLGIIWDLDTVLFHTLPIPTGKE